MFHRRTDSVHYVVPIFYLLKIEENHGMFHGLIAGQAVVLSQQDHRTRGVMT